LGDSFERLDKMGAIVACGIGEQADKLADEYLRLAEQNASVVVVSQTWSEVHRVNSRVRDTLKGKGLLGAADSAVQALERIDLTNAQKRDERFYPTDAVIVFNQKVREIMEVDPVDGREQGSNRVLASSHYWAYWESVFFIKKAIEKKALTDKAAPAGGGRLPQGGPNQ